MFVPGFNNGKKPSFAPKVFAPSVKFIPKPAQALQTEPETVKNNTNIALTNTVFDQNSTRKQSHSEVNQTQTLLNSEKNTLNDELSGSEGSVFEVASDSEDDEDLQIFNSHKRKTKSGSSAAPKKVKEDKIANKSDKSNIIMVGCGIQASTSSSNSVSSYNNHNKTLLGKPFESHPLSKQNDSGNRSSKSTKKTKKPVNKYELFPTSSKQPERYERITTYFKKTHEGIAGLEFKNVDGKPLIASIDYDVINIENSDGGNKVRVNDLILSVNNVDSRYSKFDRILSELQYRDSNINLSGDARAAVKHAVSDNLAVIVFARVTVA